MIIDFSNSIFSNHHFNQIMEGLISHLNTINILNTSKSTDIKYHSNKLWISTRRGVFEGLHVEGIIYIQAADHYLKIYIQNKDPYVIKSSLNDFYKNYLSRYEIFYRLSRSYIINLQKAYKIENNHLFLREIEIGLPIPKNKKDEILRVIGVKS